MLHLLRYRTIGGIDIVSDNTSLREDVDRRVAVQHLYDVGISSTSMHHLSD
jgi:hypothetical protein